MTAASQKVITIKYPTMNIGGVQSVIVSQIRFLQAAQYKIILVLDENVVDYSLPNKVKVEILPTDFDAQIAKWKSILKKNNVDTYIDHSILYNQSWITFNEAAKQLKVKSIGWIHNSFVRPMLDFTTQNVFLDENVGRFDQLIVLSDTDVNYYKLLGHKNVRFIPNPPSPTILHHKTQGVKSISKKDELEIIWVGRAHQGTKKVFDLILLMQEIVREIPRAHLSIIGPFTWDVDESEYKERIKSAGLQNNILVVGPKTQEELPGYYEKADIAVNTSVIEGFPMTLLEESTFGLPIVMYELPWLWIVKDNQGITSVSRGDYSALARSIVDIARNTRLYEQMSKASLAKANELLELDFVKLYDDLIKNKLPQKYSPPPDVIEAKNILRLINQFYTHSRDEKQAKIDNLLLNNANKQNHINNLEARLSGFLGIKRATRLLLGNIKRKLRIRTRIKNTGIAQQALKVYSKHKRIRVAVLVGEFFANDMPYNNGKGGYGVIARNYLAEHVPNRRIKIDTICGYSEGDELLTHIVDGKKKVLFLPADTQENQQKIREVVDTYDVFLSIELQYIASSVIQKTTKNQKLIYYIQDPRPDEDWAELDSVKRFRAIGYRPNQQAKDLMNNLYSAGRLVAISQGRDFIDKARRLYALPKSFDARFIPNAVTLPDPELTSAEIRSKENTIVALGRLDIVKRPWIIGEVAKRMPEYTFTFAGQVHDQEMKDAMKPYLALANVTSTGHIEQTEKDKLLRDSKLLINTSIHECIPVSFLEALSYGMPIISNRNPDSITEKFGRAVKQVNGDGFEEVDELVDGIREYMENDNLRIKTAKKGIQYIKEVHNLDKYIDDIREVIIEAYES